MNFDVMKNLITDHMIGHELRNAFHRDNKECVVCTHWVCKCKFDQLMENFLQTSKQYNLLTLASVEQTVEIGRAHV